MSKIDKVRDMFRALSFPPPQQNDMCCMTLLALAELQETSAWRDATNNWHRIHDLLGFINNYLGGSYAENTRETIRKQALHFFRSAAVIEDNGKATNSPNYRYRLTDEILQIIHRLDREKIWQKHCDMFLRKHRSLVEMYNTRRSFDKIPVQVNGQVFTFSPGQHNELQKAIIEEFAPRFAPGCECLYLGDTANRSLVMDESKLNELGINMDVNGKLPDIVLYNAEKNWLYLIEAVTSVGPVTAARKNELEEMTLDSEAGLVFITAFLDFKTFNRFASQIAWDTEIWLASAPDHMIHLNGDRFIGPRN